MTKNYLNILAETIRNNWDQPALTDFYLAEDGSAQDTSRGNHYTYGEMYAEICRVANLLTNLGLQKGDHIAICGANSAHWAIAYLAIAKMQGVSVTIMHSLQPDDIAHLVDFSDAKALFTDGDLWNELKGLSLPQLQSVISLGDWQVLKGENISIFNFQSSISKQDCAFPQSAPDDLAMICFTSGTSGNAKGVMLGYGGISSNLLAYNKLFTNDTSNRNYLLLLPLAHISSFWGELLPALLRGKEVYIYSGGNIIQNIHKAIIIVRPYLLIEVPMILTALYSKYGYKEYQSYIKQISTGASSIDPKFEKAVVSEAIPFSVMYGQTEATGGITFSSFRKHKIGSCGTRMDNIVKISPDGEILVKGENVMLGYYKDPEATAAKIDSDGWLHTGDKGHLDEDGYLYVEGRLEQDFIVLPNGENIRPDHIEALINALPEVSESIVLARDGKLVAIAVLSSPSLQGRDRVRLSILRAVNPQLPLFSQLYDVEISDTPLQRTEKQTLKRYLYK